MATFILSVQDTAGDPAVSATVTTADGNLSHFLAWAASVYFPLGVLTSAEGVTPATYRAPTAAEILQARLEGIWEGEKANVNSYLSAQAAAAAAAAAVQVV